MKLTNLPVWVKGFLVGILLVIFYWIWFSPEFECYVWLLTPNCVAQVGQFITGAVAGFILSVWLLKKFKVAHHMKIAIVGYISSAFLEFIAMILLLNGSDILAELSYALFLLISPITYSVTAATINRKI